MKKTNYVGIDISKLNFDVAIENEKGSYAHYKFSNDKEGFKKLSELLNKEKHCCVMEASGPYYLRLAFFLFENQIELSVINPLVIRRFSQMRMMRTKTDKKDALIIAEYGKTENPKLWKPEPDYVLELKQMQAFIDQLNKSKGSFIRQLEAFAQNPIKSAMLHKGIKKIVQDIEKQIIQIKKEMEQLVNQFHNELLKQIQSIPGLGKETSMQLIVISGGFTKFENAKQLCSYVGLCPRIFESGTSVKGRSRICKMGMSRIRAMLYVCTWSAIRCNKTCKDLYERLLAKGKAKKLALIAVANKLLKIAFAIGTKNQYYLQNN